MNPIYRSAAEAMPVWAGPSMGLMTLVFMAIFLAWVWYAYAPSRRDHLDRCANLPLDDGD